MDRVVFSVKTDHRRSNVSGTPPVYSKDATHQLYCFSAHWKLAHKGVGPTYYTAISTHGRAEQVPITSWAGPPPSPNVTCME